MLVFLERIKNIQLSKVSVQAKGNTALFIYVGRLKKVNCKHFLHNSNVYRLQRSGDVVLSGPAVYDMVIGELEFNH